MMAAPATATSHLSVITGASGLVGANLVRLLLQQNEQVRAIVHHDRRALEGLKVEITQADLADPASLEHAFLGADCVYHLAGSISLRMDNYETLAAVNITGTRNVIEACRRCGVRRLVHFSSIHTRQQKPFNLVLDEERALIKDPHVPPYERTKAQGETEILKAILQGLDAIIIIPTAILGPNDYKPSYIGSAIQMLAKGQIPALVHGGYDWVDVRDVAAGAVQAGRIGTRGRSYILSGHWHSITEVSRMVSEATGQRAPRLTVPLQLAQWAEPLMVRWATLNGSQPLYTKAMLNALRSNRHVSHARAAQDLGYHPRPLRETLQDTLAWFAEHRGEVS
jgi:dihydroflavonol-4-reductase